MKEEDISICRQLAHAFIAQRQGGVVGAPLGDGGSAVVFRWERGDGVFALKVYDPKFFSSERAKAEQHRLGLQRRLIGQHCASMVDTLAVDEELGTCFVTMEFFEGIELKRVIGKVPDETISTLVSQLVSAVVFLERFGLVHRDIKPENILVSQDFAQLRVLDLGVVREVSGDEDRADGTDHGDRRPFIATAQYSSPEYLFRLEPPSPKLWKALTIYQIGGVLHDLVCKRPLFEKAVAADNKYALAMAVMREAPDFSGVSPGVSGWAALASRCLAKDSGTRLQLVDWPDFQARTESAKDKLKRTLAARAVSADRAELHETQAHALRRARLDRATEVVEELRRQLIGEFSPQLRVSQLGVAENRAALFLKLADVELGVQLAIEFAWETGIRASTSTVRLAAKSAVEQGQIEFSGERHALGEIDTEGVTQRPLLEALVEAASDVLVKHAELAETGSIGDGADLVVLTWQQPTQL